MHSFKTFINSVNDYARKRQAMKKDIDTLSEIIQAVRFGNRL